ncbi:MAG TPA: NAD-dependent DNA ligase LigA, partial [Spirochaetota bacterium]|nr:NAD-dependent DNA ligase LigA [Spirochaetota bacterium]
GLETGNFNARLSSFDSITNYYTQAKAKRNELKFEADGIVVKINRLEDQQLLGVSGKRPRYAIAWKFPPDIKTTYLKNINFQVGRTGLITPVGILEPVKINGAVISKVTLHNRKEIAKKDIRLNDKVEVIRSGDVIPKLLKPVTAARKGNEKKIIFPGSCPECGTALAKEDIYTRCVNPACPAKILNSIIHFASKEAMDIDGLGSEMLYTMIKKKIIKSIPDLYRLQPDQLDSFERMGAKLKANIINSINNSKKRPLDRLIYALGIRYIGAKTAKLLARKYKKIENLFDISRDELSQINEIGDTIACSVADYFNKPENKQTVRQLLELGVTPGIPAAGKQHFLSNKKIIFTGSLSIPRHRAKELALKAGADIVSAVSKKTDLVIAGEKPGSKYRKALAMNVKIVTEKKFLDMVKDLQ